MWNFSTSLFLKTLKMLLIGAKQIFYTQSAANILRKLYAQKPLHKSIVV